MTDTDDQDFEVGTPVEQLDGKLEALNRATATGNPTIRGQKEAKEEAAEMAELGSSIQKAKAYEQQQKKQAQQEFLAVDRKILSIPQATADNMKQAIKQKWYDSQYDTLQSYLLAPENAAHMKFYQLRYLSEIGDSSMRVSKKAATEFGGPQRQYSEEETIDSETGATVTSHFSVRNR